MSGKSSLFSRLSCLPPSSFPSLLLSNLIMEHISSAIRSTPFLRDLSPTMQTFTLVALSPIIIVALNVASQLLLPKKHSAPPTVFHLFPIIGSAVTYGMDPYKFFFSNREKVSAGRARLANVGSQILIKNAMFQS